MLARPLKTRSPVNCALTLSLAKGEHRQWKVSTHLIVAAAARSAVRIEASVPDAMFRGFLIISAALFLTILIYRHKT